MERIPAELVIEILQHAGAIVSQRVLDALCERIPAVRRPRARQKKDPPEPPSAHQELDGLLQSAVKVKAALVLVCRQWRTLFVPYLYSISYVRSARAAKTILKTLEVHPELGTHIRQIIAIPANLESWTPHFPDIIDSLVSLCPDVVRFTLLHRDNSTEEEYEPLASRPLIQRTSREWNHLRHLMVSSLTWDSFVTYVVAIAGSSKLQSLHIYGVSIQRVDLTEARGFLPPYRDLFSLRELAITNANSHCLDLLRSYRFSRLRSFTFYGDVDNLTELSLAAFLGPDFFSLEYLSLPYSALRVQRVILPSGSYTIRTRLRTIVLTLLYLGDAIGAPKFPRIPLHRVETIQIAVTHEPSSTLLAKSSFRVWLGGLCDKRRMPDLCQIRMDIVLGRLEKEDLERVEPSLRKIERSLRAKKVVLKVLDASGTKFETLSAALGAKSLRIMGD
jgi:hypothetical protein